MEHRYLPLQTFNATQTISRCAIPIDLGYQSAYIVNYVPAGKVDEFRGRPRIVEQTSEGSR